MYFIGEVGLESQHHQSGLIEALNNYHGNDGHEKVTPIGVIQEIYASNQPVLLTMLHLSFSELFQNTQIWASLNSSNQALIQPRSDALMLESARALEQANSEGDSTQMRTLINNKINLLNSAFISNDFKHLRAPNII